MLLTSVRGGSPFKQSAHGQFALLLLPAGGADSVEGACPVGDVGPVGGAGGGELLVSPLDWLSVPPVSPLGPELSCGSSGLTDSWSLLAGFFF